MHFVYGLNKSGLSIIKFFIKYNKQFKCWDDNLQIRKKLKKSINNLKLVDFDKVKNNQYDDFYISPGISLRQKKFSKIKNFKLLRDLNLYNSNVLNEKIVAITGTNGKSTTTKLIGEMFLKSKNLTFIGGNIGLPLMNSFLTKKKYKYHVIELSSFQLEKIKNFNPYVSILLNLSKDHLDRYTNYQNYINQKKKIFSKNGIGYNLISIDDIYSKKLINNKKIPNKISFSVNNSKANIYFKGKYIHDNFFYLNKKIKIEKISKDLYGNFNLQNIIVAYIVSRIFKISINIFKDNIKNFEGLPHRCSIVKDNQEFIAINNSKATNLEATCNAIENYKEIILILGGRAKERNFSKLNKFTKNIKKVYIYGESAKMISNQIKSTIKKHQFKNLEEIVYDIFNSLKTKSKKTTILFAPGCTSFDQYENFETRGQHFIKLINSYSSKF